MNGSSRTQGILICVVAGGLGVVFLLGLLAGAYWAVAIPIAILLLFVLGLTFWVGFTIATVQVDPEPPVDDPAETSPGSSHVESGS